MKSITAISAFFLIFMFATIDLKAEVYSWTDENGVKHFSDTPPENATNVRVEFPKYRYDESQDRKQAEIQEKALEDVSKELSREEEQQKQQLEEADKNRPPTEEERIAAEKERLEKTIAELEEKPLEYFGSQKNKRVRLGYYRYRLEALINNPKNYFENPQGFEGNIKETTENN